MKRSSRRWNKKNQMRWKWQRKRIKKERRKRRAKQRNVYKQAEGAKPYHNPLFTRDVCFDKRHIPIEYLLPI